MRLNDRPDDGSSDWAAEAAAGLIGLAWYRAVEKGDNNPANLMLTLAHSAREHITQEQWSALYAER
jgi:hypothetical protein